MSTVTKWEALRDKERPAKPPKPPIDFQTVLQLSSLPPSEADTIQRNAAGARRIEDFRTAVQTARNDDDRKAAHKCVADELKRLLPWGDKERAARRAGLLALRAREADIRVLWRQTADRWLRLEQLREASAFGPAELSEHARLRLERERLYALMAQFKHIPAELRSLVPDPIGEALKQCEDVRAALGRVPKLDADPAIAEKVAAVTQHVSARHQVLADAVMTLSWDELTKMDQTNE